MTKIIKFNCDCGFEWEKGFSGQHNCSPFYRETIDGQNQEIADQKRKIEDKAKLIKGVDKANSEMAQQIADLKSLVDFDTKAILKDSDTIDAQQQEIECLKKQIEQLKAENISMAAYAEQRINMLTRANKKLGGEL